MSTVAQPTLFSWQEADRCEPIVLLGRTLDALPDEALLDRLQRERRGKRDEYPLRSAWRALVAGAMLGRRRRGPT